MTKVRCFIFEDVTATVHLTVKSQWLLAKGVKTFSII